VEARAFTEQHETVQMQDHSGAIRDRSVRVAFIACASDPTWINTRNADNPSKQKDLLYQVYVFEEIR
jgi:hypothetical protein